MTTTLKTLWQRTADEIAGGRHALLTTSVQAVGPDPGRWLISSLIRAGGQPPSWVGSWYVNNTGTPGAGRIVYEEPGLGALAVSVPFAGAQPINVEFELFWPLPGSTDSGANDLEGAATLAAMIRQAGWEVWYPDRLNFTSVAGQYSYDLPAWLDDETRIMRDAQGRPMLLDAAVTPGYPLQMTPWRYDGLILDAGTSQMRLKRAYLSSGAVFQLGVLAPASGMVNDAVSTTGPTASTDTVAADPREVIEVAKLRAYRYLAGASHVTSEERARYAALIAPQEQLVRATVRHYLPRDEMPAASPGGAT